MIGDIELARISTEILLKEDRPRGRFTAMSYYVGGIPDLSGSPRDFDGYVPIKGSINPQTGKEKRFHLKLHKFESPEANKKKAYNYYAVLLNDNDSKLDRTVVFVKAPTTYGESYRLKKLEGYLRDSYNYDQQIVQEIRVSPGLIDMIKWRDCKLSEFKKARQKKHAEFEEKYGVSEDLSSRLVTAVKQRAEAQPRPYRWDP